MTLNLNSFKSSLELSQRDKNIKTSNILSTLIFIHTNTHNIKTCSELEVKIEKVKSRIWGEKLKVQRERRQTQTHSPFLYFSVFSPHTCAYTWTKLMKKRRRMRMKGVKSRGKVVVFLSEFLLRLWLFEHLGFSILAWILHFIYSLWSKSERERNELREFLKWPSIFAIART